MAPSLWPETWPTDHPDYPRRRMQRREWQSLNGTWEFAVAGGVEHPSAIPAWDRQIVVPFAPESVASGIDDRTLGADVWYRRDDRVHAARGRAAPAAFRSGGLPSEGLGRRPFRRPARGRAHPVLVRHHRRAQEEPRGARDRGVGARRAPGPGAATRQAGLAGRAAQHLVSAHHRHLADRLARGGAVAPPVRCEAHVAPGSMDARLRGPAVRPRPGRGPAGAPPSLGR